MGRTSLSDESLLVSEIEFALLRHSEDLLSAVFEATSACNCFDGAMTLNLNFRVLLPTSNVHGHVVKRDFLLQEFVHLPLNRVFVARLHKRCCVVNASHRVKVFVLAREDAARSEVVIKQVLPVTSVRDAIVN